MSCPYCKRETPSERHSTDCAFYDGRSRFGVWTLQKYTDGKWSDVSSHEGWNDCDGDELFDRMDVDWDDYETDGDREYVAVMPKGDNGVEYGWSFAVSED